MLLWLYFEFGTICWEVYWWQVTDSLESEGNIGDILPSLRVCLADIVLGGLHIGRFISGTVSTPLCDCRLR